MYIHVDTEVFKLEIVQRWGKGVYISNQTVSVDLYLPMKEVEMSESEKYPKKEISFSDEFKDNVQS